MQRRHFRFISPKGRCLAALAVAITLAGCRESPDADPSGIQADAKAVPAAPRELFAVEVNAKKLLRRDLDALIALRMAQQNRDGFAQADEDTSWAAFEREIVERFIREIVLLDEARRAGLRLEANDLDAAIQELKKQVPPSSTFAQELRRRNLTEQGLRQNRALRTGLLIEKLFESRVPLVENPGEEDLRAEYEMGQSRMHVPVSVQLRHLVVGSAPNSDEAERAGERALAQQCRARLLDGEDFEAMAKAQSDGPAKSFGGNMGTMTIPDVRAVFGDAVADASLSQGLNEIGDVIESELGYSIVQVLARSPARTRPFEEVRAGLEKVVRSRRQSEARQAYFESVRRAATITYPDSS
jgi:parvulin-like peptidyl-prolyl isomerase